MRARLDGCEQPVAERQNWQSEFLALGCIAVPGVDLRQRAFMEG